MTCPRCGRLDACDLGLGQFECPGCGDRFFVPVTADYPDEPPAEDDVSWASTVPLEQIDSLETARDVIRVLRDALFRRPEG